MILTDLPYGQLVEWQGAAESAPAQLMEALKPRMQPHTILAISADKAQQVAHPDLVRVEKFQVGKRRISLFRSA